MLLLEEWALCYLILFISKQKEYSR